jgi:Skp family chaperone for outer membrane proteins
VADEDLKNLRARHEKELAKLNEELDLKKSKEGSALKDRLAQRRYV